MAARATLALKPGVWFRRGRLLIVSPDSLGTACPLSGRNSTYRLVQILEAGSDTPNDSPAGTSGEVVTKLNAAAIAALADTKPRQRLTDLGQEIPELDRQTPKALAAFQRAEIEKWWPIIRAANIKPE
jgi:hypothetical protein